MIPGFVCIIIHCRKGINREAKNADRDSCRNPAAGLYGFILDPKGQT